MSSVWYKLKILLPVCLVFWLFIVIFALQNFHFYMLRFSISLRLIVVGFLKYASVLLPCPGGSGGWSTVPYTKRLQVWSLVGWGIYRRQPIDVSHINASSSLSPPDPSALSQISKHILGWRFEKKSILSHHRDSKAHCSGRWLPGLIPTPLPALSVAAILSFPNRRNAHESLNLASFELFPA